jgi:hypothetical protein
MKKAACIHSDPHVFLALVQSRRFAPRISFLIVLVTAVLSIATSDLRAATISYLTQDRTVSFRHSVGASYEDQRQFFYSFDLFNTSLGKLREVTFTLSGWVSNGITEILGPCLAEESGYSWRFEEGYELQVPGQILGDYVMRSYSDSGVVKKGESVAVSYTDVTAIHDVYQANESLLGEYIGTAGSFEAIIDHNGGTMGPDSSPWLAVRERDLKSNYTGRLSLTYAYERVPDSGSSMLFLGMAVAGLIRLRVMRGRTL